MYPNILSLLLAILSIPSVIASCTPGQFLNGSTCTDCPVGTYSTTTTETQCSPCDAGSYQASTGQTSCTLCAEGTYGAVTGQTSSGAACTGSCIAGKSSPAGSDDISACVDCLSGTYSTGGTACLPLTHQCDAGKYYKVAATADDDAGACTSCPIGIFTTDGLTGQTSVSSCTICAPGYAGTITGSGSTSAACNICAAGSYAAAARQTSCTPCSVGFYQASQGQSSCSSTTYTCSAGQKAVTGASSSSNGCENCEAGTYQSATGHILTCLTLTANLCPAGKYAIAGATDNTDAGACTDCPAGSSKSTAGNTASCTPCAAGSYQALAGQSSCTLCAAGTYGTNTGQTSSGAACTGSCIAGKSSPAGSNDISDCTDCLSGTYSTGGTACLPLTHQCAAGKYYKVAATADDDAGACISLSQINAQRYSPSNLLVLKIGNRSACSDVTVECAVPVFLEEISSNGTILSSDQIYGTDGLALTLSSIDTLSGSLERCGDGTCVTASLLSGVNVSDPLTGSKSVFVRTDYNRIIKSTVPTQNIYSSVCSRGWVSNAWADFVAIGGGRVTQFDSSATTSTIIQFNPIVTTQITSCSSPNLFRHVFSTYDTTNSKSSIVSVISTDYTVSAIRPIGTSFPSNTNRFKQVVVGHELTVSDLTVKAWAIDSVNNRLASFTMRESFYGQSISYSNFLSRHSTNLGLAQGSDMTGIALSLDEQTLYITTQSGLFSLSVTDSNAVVKKLANVTNGFEYRGVAMAPLKCLPGLPGYSCDNEKLRPCKPGTSSFSAGGTCFPCALGTISTEYGMTNCTACPTGSYGSSFSRTECTKCRSGTYAPLTGSVGCTFCNDRVFCPIGSTNNSVVCPPGIACKFGDEPLICQPGTFSFRNSTSCQPCPPGMYCPSVQLGAPIPCPRGRYRSSPGASSLNDCLFADPGNYAPGNTSFQTPCRVGSYQDFSGQWSPACLDCGQGTWSNVVGRTIECELCPAGSYCQDPRSQFPRPCDSGFFSPITGAASSQDCYSCPEGTFALTAGTTGLDVMAKPTLMMNSTTCALCLAGYYCGKQTGAPTPCDAGKFSHETGATTVETCRNCDPGFFCAYPGTSDETKPCPSGWFCPGKGVASYQCEAGTYSPVNPLDGCVKCPSNTFSQVIGAGSIASCRTCPTGTSSDKIGASTNTSCYTCPPGKYSTGDAPTCAECPSGYHCPGDAPRKICPLHTFNPNRRSTRGLLCLSCPAGSGTNATGTISSTDCSPKFSPILISASISVSGVSYTSVLVSGAKNFTRDVQAIISATIKVDPNLVSLGSVKDTSSSGQRLLRLVTGSGIIARTLTGAGSILISIRVLATSSSSSSVISAVNGISSSPNVLQMIASAASVPLASVTVTVTSVTSANSPTPSGAFVPPPPPAPETSFPLTTIIAASVGGGVGLLIILTVVYLRCCRRKVDANLSTESSKTVPTLESSSSSTVAEKERSDAFAVRNPMISVEKMEATLKPAPPPPLLPPPALRPPPTTTTAPPPTVSTIPIAPPQLSLPPPLAPPPSLLDLPLTLPPPSMAPPPSLPPPSLAPPPSLPPPSMASMAPPPSLPPPSMQTEATEEL